MGFVLPAIFRRFGSETQTTMNQDPDRIPGEPDAKPPRWLVLAAFAAVYIIWGSTYLGIHIAIETIPPFLMAGTRYLAAGTVFNGR